MRNKYGDRIYSDNTLRNMTKEELIEQIRILEHNHEILHERVENQANAFPVLAYTELEEVLSPVISKIKNIPYSYDFTNDANYIIGKVREIIHSTLEEYENKAHNSTIHNAYEKLIDEAIEKFAEYCYVNGISFSYCTAADTPAIEVNRKIIDNFYEVQRKGCIDKSCTIKDENSLFLNTNYEKYFQNVQKIIEEEIPSTNEIDKLRNLLISDTSTSTYEKEQDERDFE